MEGAVEEERIDPDDGRAYTLKELKEKYFKDEQMGGSVRWI